LGAWDHSILGNDVSAQVYHLYTESIAEGLSATQANRLVHDEYGVEFEDHENEFNAIFGLGLAKWETGNLDSPSLATIRDLINNDLESRIYRTLEYRSSDIEERRLVLKEFLVKLESSAPKKKTKKQKRPVVTFNELFRMVSDDGQLVVTASESFVDGVYRATSCSAMWDKSGDGGVFQFQRLGETLNAKWTGTREVTIFHSPGFPFQQKNTSLYYSGNTLVVRYVEASD